MVKPSTKSRNPVKSRNPLKRAIGFYTKDEKVRPITPASGRRQMVYPATRSLKVRGKPVREPPTRKEHLDDIYEAVLTQRKMEKIFGWGPVATEEWDSATPKERREWGLSNPYTEWVVVTYWPETEEYDEHISFKDLNGFEWEGSMEYDFEDIPETWNMYIKYLKRYGTKGSRFG